jgi:hypothetical protein
LIAIGCNIGPQRMAVASGLSVEQISFVADWHLTEDALKAASIDLIKGKTQETEIYARLVPRMTAQGLHESLQQ